MQNWGFKTVFRLMAIIGVMAGMLTIFACAADDEPLPEPIPVIPPAPKVAASSTTVPVNATTVRALENQPFVMPTGAFAGTALAGQTTTVRFTNTATATPTGTITTASGGTATGNTTFGSCIFTITSSNIPGVTVGQTITVNPCQYVVATGGVQATGNATTVQILLQLGIVPSAANQASVAIDPNTGVVTVNNVNTGVSVTLVVSTGTSGG
jgi:hypothetical protein